jgi:hypothetical protein
MRIFRTEIIEIFDEVLSPPYYHPKGNFLVPIIKKEVYGNGNSAKICSYRGFSTNESARIWIEVNRDLIKTRDSGAG